jgi:non-heme chloroperoxidase
VAVRPRHLGVRRHLQGRRDNRPDFYLQFPIPFVGQYACIREFSKVDYIPDLRAIDVPTLVIHGDDDQIVPICRAGSLTATIVTGTQLKVYEGGSHGLAATHQDRLDSDLLAFAKA